MTTEITIISGKEYSVCDNVLKTEKNYLYSCIIIHNLNEFDFSTFLFNIPFYMALHINLTVCGHVCQADCGN